MECANVFPLEPAFAITIHKVSAFLHSALLSARNKLTFALLQAQGRTISKVILCLSEHPTPFLKLKWESLYVALSRIRTREDLRLLLRKKDRETMNYVSQLKKDDRVHHFFQGYADNENDIPVKWNARRALRAAQLI